MEPSLDSLLTASAPPTSRRTPEIERVLSDLVADTERHAVANRSRPRSRIAISGLAAVTLLGLSAGASAAGVLPAPEWAPWYESPTARHSQSVTSGAVCAVSYGVKAIEDQGQPVSHADRAAAVAEAERFVRDFDFSRVDVAQAVRKVPLSATQPEDGPEERETLAVLLVLQERLDAHLAHEGLPASVSVSTAQTCEGGEE